MATSGLPSTRRTQQASAAVEALPGVLKRNNTSFPIQITEKLRELYAQYVAAQADEHNPNHVISHYLRYYQYLVRAVLSDPTYGYGQPGNSRGLLVYEPPGLGKSRLAVTSALVLRKANGGRTRGPIVLLPRGLQGNFAGTIAQTVEALNPGTAPDALEKLKKEVAAWFTYVSTDAYNAADQLERVEGGLNGRQIIVDEAHDFFASIINGGANARKLYAAIMAAKDLIIIFLTGTMPAKDPYEIVPCANMLTGEEILPPQYDVFYDLYVDQKAMRLKNRGKLANRLVGLVSHASHWLPNTPSGIAGAPKRQLRDQGWFPEEHPTVVERIPMGEAQYRHYVRAREQEESENQGRGQGGPRGLGQPVSAPLTIPGADRKSASTYYVKSRTTSTFAPDPKWAAMPASLMPAAAFTPEAGPKLAFVADRALKAKGIVLVYSQFVEKALEPFGRYLEVRGFERHSFAPATLVGEAAGEAAGQAAEKKSEAADEAAGQAAEKKEGGADSARATFKAVGATGAEALCARLQREGLYVESEARAAAAAAAVEHPTAESWYDPERLPSVQYRRAKGERARPSNLVNLHHGQRKLFVSELQCLAALLPAADAEAVVVYPGAAPGHHFDPLLLRLYPNVVWHLVDPAAFAVKDGPRVRTYQKYFTDELAQSWAGRCDIFICDIRVGVEMGGESWTPDFEAQVAADMAAQERWVRLVRPRLGALLKFRPPYVEPGAPHTIDYMAGRVLRQTWPSNSSTEGRLLVRASDLDAPPMRFDAARYQDACAEHNMIVRPWMTFCPPAPGLERVPGYDRCYDCTNEAAAWVAYGRMKGAAPGDAARWMRALTTQTRQRLDAPPGSAHGHLPLLPAAERLERLYGGDPLYAQLKQTKRPARKGAEGAARKGAAQGGAPAESAIVDGIYSLLDEVVHVAHNVHEVENVRAVQDSEPRNLRESAVKRGGRGGRGGRGQKRRGQDPVAEQTKDSDRGEAPQDFPFRVGYMPPPSVMFARLRKLGAAPPPEWADARQAGGRIALVRRTFPEDYEASDSLTDHFVEHARIMCRERGCPSPAEAWRELRGGPLPDDTRERRELVHARARGCNLFNNALGTYLLAHFGAKRVLDCTAGWGDRLVSAFAAGVQYYRGWDTNPALQPVYARIAAELSPLAPPLDWKIELGPFERAAARFSPGGDLCERFDLCLFCPPFFDKEVYQGPNTSTEAHPTLGRWYREFYGPAVAAAARGLAPGGRLVAYVTDGRMRREAEKAMKGALGAERVEYVGTVGFQQVLPDLEGPVRDAFVWQVQPLGVKRAAPVRGGGVSTPAEDAAAAGRPVEQRPVAVLAGALAQAVWDGGALQPQAVLDEMMWRAPGTESHAGHAARIRAADMASPLLLRAGRLIDGWHRLCRAVLEGRETVEVRDLGAATGGAPADTPAGAYPNDADVVEEARPEAVPPRAQGRPRYMLITGKVSQADRQRIKEIMTAPNNTRGEVVKVIVVSKAGASGLDLKGIREVYQLEPYWNKTRDAQVKGRGSRQGSHDALPREDRDVRPHLCIAVANTAVRDLMLPQDREAMTIDEQFHERALNRHRLNSDLSALLAEVSIEASLFGYDNCRTCAPTNVPLFRGSPELDVRLPDPCVVQEETTVSAIPLELDGRTYYYTQEGAGSEPSFYEFSQQLGGHVPVDPADPALSALRDAVQRLA